MNTDRWNSAVVQRCDNYKHAARCLREWSTFLRDMELHETYGVFVAIESGVGWCIKIGRHDDQPLQQASGVVLIPRPR